MTSTPLHVAVFHLRDEFPAQPRFHAELMQLNDGTAQALAHCGMTATFIPAATTSSADCLTAARRADAVIILGGDDVDPRFYGGSTNYHDRGHLEPAADAHQIAVVQDALHTLTPLLGICRGTQIINVACGGTLVQHVSTSPQHRGAADSEDSFVWTTPRRLGAAELVADLGATSPVRCSHHQALGVLGAGLEVCAVAADGVVEAVVHDSAPITGVQWHPEHPSTTLSQLTLLLERLRRQVAAAAAS